jgi:hypothetical protein
MRRAELFVWRGKRSHIVARRAKVFAQVQVHLRKPYIPTFMIADCGAVVAAFDVVIAELDRQIPDKERAHTVAQSAVDEFQTTHARQLEVVDKNAAEPGQNLKPSG